MGKGNGHFSKKNRLKWLTDMKKCWGSLAIREIQMKTTLRYHLALVRLAYIQN